MHLNRNNKESVHSTRTTSNNNKHEASQEEEVEMNDNDKQNIKSANEAKQSAKVSKLEIKQELYHVSNMLLETL